MSKEYLDTSQVWKEITYLTKHIEQKLNEKKSTKPPSFIYQSGIMIDQSIATTQLQSAVPTTSTLQFCNNKVYINPNYQKKQPVIHINPQKCGKGIYVNPKLIEMKPSMNQEHKSGQNLEIQTISSSKNDFPPTETTNIVKSGSVYVKPDLIKKIVKSVASEKCSERLIVANSPPKKTSSSPLVSISRRKLIKSSSKIVNNALSNRSPDMRFKKSISLSRQKLNVNNVSNIVCHKSIYNYVNGRTKNGIRGNLINKYKIDRTYNQKGIKRQSSSIINKYKVDRTCSPREGRKSRLSLITKYKLDRSPMSKSLKKLKIKTVNKYKVVSSLTPRRIKQGKRVFDNKNIRDKPSTIVIEGHSYKSSRNKLTKNINTPNTSKRKSFPVSKTEQFLITKNGKKLHRIVVKTPNPFVKTSTSTATSNKNISIRSTKSIATPKRSQMKYLSTNARQRSLQLMQSKFRKNNQPCLVFRRYGHCPKQARGICSRVHNRKQVALCSKFLQGKCLSDNCKLSHDVGPEKMPTCKYFLDGCCSRESCPYRHIKVSDKTPICVKFLDGYCEKGNECKDRHIFLCPEFEKHGSCNKGKNCAYPHKSAQVVKKQNNKSAVIENTIHKQPNVNTLTSATSTQTVEENCKRYYDDKNNQELARKRIKLLKQVRVMKKAHVYDSKENEVNDEDDDDSDIYVDNTDDDIIIECIRIKKPPLGTLPSFIPIN